MSVCSNVPEYQEPKCFVCSGEPREFTTEFIQYLVSISTKSSSLSQVQYAPMFEALNNGAVFSHGETYEDRLAETLVDIQEVEEDSEKEDESWGIDLMASDDEQDEEEIELDNEEDRAFLDEVNENDPSFYRRSNIELDRNRRQEQRQRHDEITDCEEMLFGEVRTSDNKVLKELAEKLNTCIQELPMLGFNSGKYDLNAWKEFLFPVPDRTPPHQVHCQEKKQSRVSGQIC